MTRTCQCKNRNPSDHTRIFFFFNVLHIILGPFLFNMIHNDWFIIIPTSLHFRRENPLIWNWLCVLKPKKGQSKIKIATTTREKRGRNLDSLLLQSNIIELIILDWLIQKTGAYRKYHIQSYLTILDNYSLKKNTPLI